MPALGGVRGRHLFVVDLVVIALAIVGAMVLRFDSLRFAEEALIYFPAALFPLVVRPPINVLGGLYARAWAYASVGELARIAVVVAVGSVVGVLVFYGVLVPLGVPGTTTPVGTFPRSFFILEGLLTLAGMGGARFLIRASSEWKGWRPGDPDRRRSRDGAGGDGHVPTLVYGAGDVGATVIRTIATARDGLGMRVVGLLDDDPRKRNQILRGQKVLGSLDELADIARVTGAHRLLDRDPVGLGRHRPQGGRSTRPRSVSRHGPCRRSTSSSRDGWARPRSARCRSRTSSAGMRSPSTSPASGSSSAARPCW